MSNDIQYYNGNADNELAEIQRIGYSDMAIPRMMVVQGTSKMQDAGRHGGDFFNSVTSEFKPSIKAIMVAPARKLRALFPWIDNGEKDELLCRSANFIEPIGKYIGTEARNVTIPELCQECPLQDWVGDAPPQCTMMYNILFIDIESGMPFTMSFMKTAIKAAKNLNTIYATFGSNAVVMLQTKKREDGGKSYYSVDVILKRDVEIPEAVKESCARYQYNAAPQEVEAAEF